MIAPCRAASTGRVRTPFLALPLTRRRQQRRATMAGLLLAALLLAIAALGATACGNGATPTSSASPSASLPPGATTPRAAAIAFWRMTDRNDFTDLATIGTTALLEHIAPTPLPVEVVDAARLVRLSKPELAPDGSDRWLAVATVWVDPADGGVTWGQETGEHTRFMYFVKSPGGDWLVDAVGTGP